MTLSRRVLNLIIALDQLLYVLITLGAGFPDETLSSAAYRLEQRGAWWGRVWRPLIDMLFFFQPDHCRIAFECERQRVQAPPETRR